MNALHSTSIRSLPLISKGKVRDVYAVGDDCLLMITTDRISAFDVIMQEGIPEKGMVLNQMSNFWFAHLAHVIPNHLTGIDPSTVVASNEIDQVKGRAVVAKRLKPILVEAVIRGYLAGSGWKDYQETGAVCGIVLPAGMQNAQVLAEPIFTPAAKAEMGQHDENISYAEVEKRIGSELVKKIRETSIRLYREAAQYALEKGIIIADTKFEFGLDEKRQLVLMDEILTADSSRFWPASDWKPGNTQLSYDKQFLRDWLTASGWDRSSPPPELPDEIVEKTRERYLEAYFTITGERFK